MLSVTNEIEFKKRVNRLGWALAIMVGLMNVLGLIYIGIYQSLLAVGSESLMVTVGTLFEAVFYVSYFLIPAALFYAMSRNIPTRPVKFKIRFSKYLPLMILSGIGIILAASYVNYYFCDLFGYYASAGEDYTQYLNDPEIVAWFMTVSLAPAFAEELLFRGVVYTNLRTYGKTFAVLISAVSFAFMHQNVGQFFYTLVAGVVLALIYEATNSIWGGVFLHLFNNFYTVFESTVLYRFDETSAYVILSSSRALLILLGVISTICLVAVKRKQERKENSKQPQTPVSGFYGEDRANDGEAYAAPMPFGAAFKAMICTPGMIAYAALVISTALIDLLM